MWIMASLLSKDRSSTPVPIEIKNGIENFPPGIFAFAAQRFWFGQEWFNDLPLFVTQVSRVSFSGRHIC
jgi:hypothetical protein